MYPAFSYLDITYELLPLVISYKYDPLGRLVEADYSTPSTGSGQAGEAFEYCYDAVGNRKALTVAHESRITHYEYDAANRLTKVGDTTYTWDERGNLTHDGTFTYTYNAAGRMVRAENVTTTLLYTYTADGLRVAQAVDGDVTTFAWDWASGLPEMLVQSPNPPSPNPQSLYLVGHDTLGRFADGEGWAYHLPDALGSVRQVVDGAGSLASSREWTPFGVEVGAAQAGLGYTGEYWDADVGLQYLRVRWYDVSVGRFTRKDPFSGVPTWPQSQNPYPYAANNPVLQMDPSGEICWPCAVLLAAGLFYLATQTGCTAEDYDCNNAEIELALTDVVCEGEKCSRAMTAAFWLPRGNKKAFKDNCVVVQWARGEMTEDGIRVTCQGPDCSETWCTCGSSDELCNPPRLEKWCGWCPPGGSCITASSSDWHIDQYHNKGPDIRLYDDPSTYEYDFDQSDLLDWEDYGLVVPQGVPLNAVYTHDLPKVGNTEPGHVVKADMEFVIAVYNREDIEKLPMRGGDLGNPYGPPLPCATEKWEFKTEPYTTR